MIDFTRGFYDGPGKVLLSHAPPGMGDWLSPTKFGDELHAETPHPPVLTGSFVARTTVVLWLRRAGWTIEELPPQGRGAGSRGVPQAA
jgi:hypothetical protein